MTEHPLATAVEPLTGDGAPRERWVASPSAACSVPVGRSTHRTSTRSTDAAPKDGRRPSWDVQQADRPETWSSVCHSTPPDLWPQEWVVTDEEWQAELARLDAELDACAEADARRRRNRLDGGVARLAATADPDRPVAAALLGAVEEVLAGRPTSSGDDPEQRGADTLGDAVVSAFVAVRRVTNHGVWLQVALAARLLGIRSGPRRGPSLPARARRRPPDRAAAQAAADGPGADDPAEPGADDSAGPRADDSDTVDEVVTELALAAGIPPGAAAVVLDLARTLVVDGRLPVTAGLFRGGILDLVRVRSVVLRTRDLTVEQAAAVEALVYPTRGLLEAGPGRFDSAVDRAVQVVDAEAAEERRRRARRGRRVGVRGLPDGQALLTAVGPAEALAAAYAGVDATARAHRRAGDPRTLEQLRFDALVTCCATGTRPDGPLPGGPCRDSSPPQQDTSPASQPHDQVHGAADAEPGGCPHPWLCTQLPPGVQVRVDVTVTAETLMGLSREPGELRGYGPIPAQAIRDLVTGGVFRCVVVDGRHGTVLGVGRSTFTPGYVAGAGLRDFLAVAAPICDVPGCTVSAVRCDRDHRIPYAAGGATCSCNVAPKCRKHHRLKTAGRLHHDAYPVTPSTSVLRAGGASGADPTPPVGDEAVGDEVVGDTARHTRPAGPPPGTTVYRTRTGRTYPSYPRALPFTPALTDDPPPF